MTAGISAADQMHEPAEQSAAIKPPRLRLSSWQESVLPASFSAGMRSPCLPCCQPGSNRDACQLLGWRDVGGRSWFSGGFSVGSWRVSVLGPAAHLLVCVQPPDGRLSQLSHRQSRADVQQEAVEEVGELLPRLQVDVVLVQPLQIECNWSPEQKAQHGLIQPDVGQAGFHCLAYQDPAGHRRSAVHCRPAGWW